MTRWTKLVWIGGAAATAACTGRGSDAPSRAADTVFAPAAATGNSSTPGAGSASAAPMSGSNPESEWQVGPGRAGPITGEISEAQLRQHYGTSEVESTRIEIGEGETAAGAVLFPRDSLRRAEIVWQDSVTRERPARIIIRGNRTQWQLPRGISLGTTLQELERVNGRPFVLAGFGWDYAGVVTNWNGGVLDSALAGMKLYLDPGPEQYQSKLYSRVQGDRDYSSSLAPMQQLNPHLATIFVDFESR